MSTLGWVGEQLPNWQATRLGALHGADYTIDKKFWQRATCLHFMGLTCQFNKSYALLLETLMEPS